MVMQSVAELAREQHTHYTSGAALPISKYVTYDMYDIICTIHAYLNNTPLSGKTDDLGRDRPFPNIVTSLRNIYFRATDVDTRNIKPRAATSKEVIPAILAKHFLRDYMRRENFAQFLNKWGLKKAGYGSASIKAVENTTGLHLSVVDWLRHVCDPIQYEPNMKTDVLELSPGQLRKRVKTHGYDARKVEELIADNEGDTRETLDGQTQGTRAGYIKVFETHYLGTVEQLKEAKGEEVAEGDSEKFVQQMQVFSTVEEIGSDGKKDKKDHVLLAVEEEEDPYMLTHLIEEDGRTLARGPVENNFDNQWMMIHSFKMQKDALDLASLLILITSDPFFAGMNVVESVESGDVFVHTTGNLPLHQVQMGKPDLAGIGAFAVSWKTLAAETAGVSEAMLGAMPPAGTSGTQLDSLLRENYSLFQTIMENAGIDINKLMRWKILPYIKKKYLSNADEIAMALDEEDVTTIDAVYLTDAAIRKTNDDMLGEIEKSLDAIGNGQVPKPIEMGGMLQRNIEEMQRGAQLMGNTRSFKPSELSQATWDEILKDFKWDMDIDTTGETEDVQTVMAAYSQALNAVMSPNFAQNEPAKAFVGGMLDIAGAMNPLRFKALVGKSVMPSPAPTAGNYAVPSNMPLSASAGASAA